MWTGLKAYGTTAKNHPGWTVILLVVLSVMALGILAKVKATVLGLPGVGPLAAKLPGASPQAGG